MKLVDKILQANEAALEWSDVQRENRLRSISQNAVLQALVPFGRHLDPVTDGDSQAQNDIFLILQRLERKRDVEPSYQHQSLTPVTRPDSDDVLDRVATALLNTEPEAVTDDAG